MADVTLSDGREVTFDLMKVTYRQWKIIWDNTTSEEETNAHIARVADMTPDELLDLPQPDFKLLIHALHRKGTQPLSVPNSQRAST